MDTLTVIEWYDMITGEWVTHSQSVRNATEAREYIEAWRRKDRQKVSEGKFPWIPYRIVTTTWEAV